MKALTVGLFSIIILSAGCTKTVVPESSGGSRSDGLVEMSFDSTTSLFGKLDIQWDKAQIEATERCKAWGYHKAKRFGRGKQECISRDGYGICLRWNAVLKYQCL